MSLVSRVLGWLEPADALTLVDVGATQGIEGVRTRPEAVLPCPELGKRTHQGVVVAEQGKARFQDILIQGGLELLCLAKRGDDPVVSIEVHGLGLDEQERQHCQQRQAEQEAVEPASHSGCPLYSPVSVLRNFTSSATSERP